MPNEDSQRIEELTRRTIDDNLRGRMADAIYETGHAMMDLRAERDRARRLAAALEEQNAMMRKLIEAFAAADTDHDVNLRVGLRAWALALLEELP